MFGADFVWFCIITYFVLRWWWKSDQGIDDGRNTVGNRFSKKRNKQRSLTDDEFIAAILPTIDNGK